MTIFRAARPRMTEQRRGVRDGMPTTALEELLSRRREKK